LVQAELEQPQIIRQVRLVETLGLTGPLLQHLLLALKVVQEEVEQSVPLVVLVVLVLLVKEQLKIVVVLVEHLLLLPLVVALAVVLRVALWV
jgi:hypothetical protein